MSLHVLIGYGRANLGTVLSLEDYNIKKPIMNKNVEKVRQRNLNEIVATLEFIDYLKFEAKGQVDRVLKREVMKKRMLVFQLELIED